VKRFLYILYYLRKLNYQVFSGFLSFACRETKRSRILILSDVVISSLNYNTSLLDYFYFRFYTRNKKERYKWAGTGFMYEYQRRMNPTQSRGILADKARFLEEYARFINRKYLNINKPHNLGQVSEMLSNPTKKLVLKNALGQVGAEVEVIACSDFSPGSLLEHMKKYNYNLIEEFVVQHPSLMGLSPSGLNTLRIITQINDDGKVDLIGARLRISVDSPVDNMAAGNLAAPVNADNGTICGPGVYSDIRKPEESIHPLTGAAIEGFQVPFWEESVEMAIKAALHHPDNRSIGWDIAITPSGPELIEGNHNWCKLLWQLPVKQGLRHVLEKYTA
jgi:hypothetical protein